MDEIVNKVAGSGIVTIDLAEFRYPGERVIFDIKPHLFNELILKEKDFREFIKNHSWSQYQDKIVILTCSADAIVPTWAYMLLALALEPHAAKLVFSSPPDAEQILFSEKLADFNAAQFVNARVVIKGCGDESVPVNAYVQIAAKLRPVAKSIMYGEPCSTVPLYKSKSAQS